MTTELEPPGAGDDVTGQREFRPATAEERAAVSYAAWVADAQEAWDSGQRFYQPLFLLAPDNMPVPAPTDLGESSRRTPRSTQAERTLEAITSVGWRLHTWAVTRQRDAFSFAQAHPLFVRDS
jgi:hypothetical protein